ncbi:hypothetical protein BT69DRAFT_675675 [Atractiella rhizophila]|nr:hypothetical protein BT69DRAFT_675675 [Atractiella rhizophila]
MSLTSLPPEVLDLIFQFAIQRDNHISPENRQDLLAFAFVHPKLAGPALRQFYVSITLPHLGQCEQLIRSTSSYKVHTKFLSLKNVEIPAQEDFNPTKELLTQVPAVSSLALDLRRVQDDPEMISFFLQESLQPIRGNLTSLELRLTIRSPILPLLSQLRALHSLSLANWESQLERSFDSFLSTFTNLKLFHMDHCLMTKAHLKKLLEHPPPPLLSSLKLISLNAPLALEWELFLRVAPRLEYLSWVPSWDPDWSALRFCSKLQHFHTAVGNSAMMNYLPPSVETIHIDTDVQMASITPLILRLNSTAQSGSASSYSLPKLRLVILPSVHAVFRERRSLEVMIDHCRMVLPEPIQVLYVAPGKSA